MAVIFGQDPKLRLENCRLLVCYRVWLFVGASPPLAPWFTLRCAVGFVLA